MDANVYRSDIRDLINEIVAKRDTGDLSVIEKCDQIIEYGEKQREKALIGFARYSKGVIYYTQNDVSNFFFEMVSARAPLLEAQEYADYAMANMMLGRMSVCRGNVPDGLDYYEIALKCCMVHRLPDTEWLVQLRLGSVYLMMDDYDRAIDHFTKALYYIEGHLKLERREEWLSSLYVGFGDVFLKKDEPQEALIYLQKIEQECIIRLTHISMMIYETFATRIFAALGDEARSETYVNKVSAYRMDNLPILDVFDELYLYQKFLLKKKDRKQFSQINDNLFVLATKTTVKYLQRKLLTLKLRADKIFDDRESMNKDAVLYFELSEALAKENRIMTKREITKRNEVKDLLEEHRKVQKENKTLHAKSETDDLTGIYNRYKLNTYGDIAFDRAIRNTAPLAVEILDIDFFGDYNDHYGSQEGDRCLRFVSEEIRGVAKEYGAVFAARYGGAEFVLIYEGYSDREVFEIAKKLRDKVNEKKIEHRYTKGKSKHVSISQGIYWGVPEDGMKLWDFLHAADNVRYRLKQKTTGSIMVGKAENERTSAYTSSDGIETVDPIVRYRGNIEDE